LSANTILTSVVTGGTNSHTTTAEEANALATDFVTQGVVGAITLNTGSGGTGSFCVNADASADMGVTIKAGQAYLTATPSSQNSQVLRARASADYTSYTINANASGSTKYDWIYLSVDATKANNPAADASDVASFVTSRSSSNTTDNGAPPTYGLLLAIVTVANGASSITNSNITDKRFNTSIGAQNGSLIVTQASTGTDAKVQAAGVDANVNISITPKGTGVVEIGENSSSVSQISASGSDSNINLKLAPKGTGVLDLNGNLLKIVTGSNAGTAGGSTNYIKIGPLAICWGVTNSMTMTSTSQVTGTIVFPITYSTSPAVSLGSIPGGTVQIKGDLNTNSSTTGVTVAGDSGSGGIVTGNVQIHWTAIGAA